jgi:hypothetical protein
MAKIFRFNHNATMHLTMQAAQEAGLPVNMPQINQGIQSLLAVFAKYGIGICVDETSPYFQNLMANYGQQGQANNTRVVAPRQAPVQQQQAMPQPQYVPAPPPQYQQPGQPMQPQAFQPPPVRREVPGAVISGQPLPDLLPPPHLRGQMPGPGITQLPPGQVQVPQPAPMPAGLGDIAPGMTEGPPTPTILE